jgi:hypothetical protein
VSSVKPPVENSVPLEKHPFRLRSVPASGAWNGVADAVSTAVATAMQMRMSLKIAIVICEKNTVKVEELEVKLIVEGFGNECGS